MSVSEKGPTFIPLIEKVRGGSLRETGNEEASPTSSTLHKASQEEAARKDHG